MLCKPKMMNKHSKNRLQNRASLLLALAVYLAVKIENILNLFKNQASTYAFLVDFAVARRHKMYFNGCKMEPNDLLPKDDILFGYVKIYNF